MTKIHFRPYIPNQTVLFPQRIDEDIAENDPVRMVDALVEGLNLESFRKLYIYASSAVVGKTRKQDNISDSSKLCSKCFNFSDCPDKYFLPAILGRMTARTLHKKEMCQFRHISSIYTK